MASPTDRSHLIALGRSIQVLREERGIASEQLAESANLRQQRMAAIEEGHLDPDYGSLVRLADALGVGVGALAKQAEAIEEAGNDRSSQRAQA